ncbi:MAG: nucleotidyltransferase family protein [Fimbriimonadaceae bacterium]|nr:nucleotidyltransferase family protein [Fimbriimonadaceae bacterium]
MSSIAAGEAALGLLRLVPARALQQVATWPADRREATRAAIFIHGAAGVLWQHLAPAVTGAPDPWVAALAEQAARLATRVAALREELQRLLTAARARGLRLLPLKGSQLLLWPDLPVTLRPQADTDVLVRPAELPATLRLLADLGYAPYPRRHKPRDQRWYLQSRGCAVQDWQGENIANPHWLEVGCTAAHWHAGLGGDLTAALWAGATVAGRLDPARLLRHLVLHTALDLLRRSGRFAQLIALGWVLQRLGPAAAGRQMATWQQPGWARLAWAVLTLQQRYRPVALPPELIPALARDVPRALGDLIAGQPLSYFSYCDPRRGEWHAERAWLDPGLPRWRAARGRLVMSPREFAGTRLPPVMPHYPGYLRERLLALLRPHRSSRQPGAPGTATSTPG